jgi:hypothetical protein
VAIFIYAYRQAMQGPGNKMSRSPKGDHRPADPNAAAVLVGPIATGDATDTVPTLEPDGKNPAAVALGRMGGKARATAMSARKRKEIAKKAAAKRWQKSS